MIHCPNISVVRRMQGDVPDEGADPVNNFWSVPGGETGKRKGHIPGLQGWIEKGSLGPGG